MVLRRISMLLLYLLCVAGATSTQAQSSSREEVLFYDNFYNNSKGWWSGYDSEKTVTIRNGIYRCENKVDPVQFCVLPIMIDQNRDFFIEGRLAYKSGTSGYGIVFGRRDDDNSWRFIATDRDGQYFIRKRVRGVSTTIQAWKTSSAIQMHNSMNTYRVEKRGGNLYFYANGTLLKQTLFDRFPGNQAGFFCGNSSTIEAEYFKVGYLDGRGNSFVQNTNTTTNYTNTNTTTNYTNTNTNYTNTTVNTTRPDYSNGPVIDIREPEIDRGFKTVPNQLLRVAGFANANSELREVTVNGVAAYLGPEHYFSANVPVNSGNNTITVRAVDSSYKSGTKTFTINGN